MGMIGDISNLIVQAYRIWQESSVANTLSPQELHDKYIAPTYGMLKQVHGDYLDMYLELEERLTAENEVSASIVEWFSRARIARQADRSELRLMDVPYAKATKDRAATINEAALAYVSSVRRYFEPEETRKPLSRERFDHLGPTASTYTERRLRIMRHWLALAEADRRVFATEEYLETSKSLPQDELIERMLAAGSGSLDPDAEYHLEALRKEADEALVTLSQLAKKPVHRAIGVGEAHWFIWSRVIHDHIWRQRWGFEEAMKSVQLSYIRFRILSDR